MRKYLILLFVSCFVLVLCACGDNKSSEKSDSLEVTVVDQDNNAVEGVTVQLCKDTCFMKTTDTDGQVIFDVEIEEGYKLSILACPDGYEYTGEAEISLDAGTAEYTLKVNKL